MGALLKQGFVAGLALLAGACASVPEPSPATSLDTIEATLARDIATLSSEEFAGRFPGTAGEEKTAAFLIDRYRAIGLQPGLGTDASGQPDWTQDFTLVRRTPGAAGAMQAKITRGQRSIELSDGLLAVHPGIDAPLLADVPLVGIDPARDTLERNSLVNRALVLSVPDLMVFGPQLALADPKVVLVTSEDDAKYSGAQRLLGQGRWRLESDESGPALMVLSPQDSDRLTALIGANAARHPDGLGIIAYDTMLDVAIRQQAERIETANIIGRLPGTLDDAGAVLVLAHWDHLGDACGPPEAADRLCNGAVDNASGIAVMLEAVRLAAIDGPLERDIIVLATSAEELGLLGAEAFVADPPVALPTIVAGFNIDTIAIAARDTPVVVLGAGETRLDYGISEVARVQGREVVPSDLQAQFLRRQDGWVFLREGVPTVLAGSALGDPEAFQAFLQGPYHGAGDEVGKGLELGGAARDTLLHAALLRYFGSLRTYPDGR